MAALSAEDDHLEPRVVELIDDDDEEEDVEECNAVITSPHIISARLDHITAHHYTPLSITSPRITPNPLDHIAMHR